VAAKNAARLAPSEQPKTVARSIPAASITARVSSILSSTDGGSLTGSESPHPRLS
jgi:hypothetical protein